MERCLLCGMVYSENTGHDYDECLKRCQKRYTETHMHAAKASRALDQATELYRQRSRTPV